MKKNLDISTLVTEHNSERTFSEVFLNLLACGAGIIHVRSHEIARTLTTLRAVSIMDTAKYFEWDCKAGTREYDIQNMPQLHVPGDGGINVLDGLKKVEDMFQAWITSMSDEDKERHYVFTFVNPQYQFENNPTTLQYFIEFCDRLPVSTVHIVLVTDDKPLSRTLNDYVVGVDFTLPGHSELMAKLNSVLQDVEDDGILDISDEDKIRIAITGAGMTGFEFELAVSRAIIETTNVFDDEGVQIGDGMVRATDIVDGVQKAKTGIVRRNDLLEIISSGDINEVGGMDLLKDWVQKRSRCYSSEFKQFGGQAPKGLVVVGVPGSGKSLLAKAVGGVLGIPIVRLDFSRVFNALVGSSEERMRTSLKMVEAMAPCVLFVDEIDKGLGGLGGSGDSGTSMRVFGTFLTWLADNEESVFTMVTANNVATLPPELLRRGRFDAIFSTTLPNEWEREDVLRIHLAKRGHDLDTFDMEEIAEFRKQTDTYVPAEIEAIVKDALVDAFSEDPDDPALTMAHLLAAAKVMVPLSKSHEIEIKKMVKWAQENAMPASLTVEEMGKLRGKVRTMNKQIDNVRQLTPRRRSRKPTKEDT